VRHRGFYETVERQVSENQCLVITGTTGESIFGTAHTRRQRGPKQDGKREQLDGDCSKMNVLGRATFTSLAQSPKHQDRTLQHASHTTTKNKPKN